MKTKTCSKCKQEKPLTTEFFHCDRRQPNGFTLHCKECRRKTSKEYATRTRDEFPEIIKERKARYYQKLKQDKVRLDVYKKRKAEWQRNKRHTDDEFRNKCLEANRRWYSENTEKANAINAKKRARKLNQTPNLTHDEEQMIIDIYKKSQELGPDWHVDHTVPLSRGGLHHPDNLQIVLKSYNLQKNDKLECEFRPPLDWEVV